MAKPRKRHFTPDELPPVLAKCSKCGRGFIALKETTPWFDGYPPSGRHGQSIQTTGTCGGLVVLTDAGRKAASGSR